MKIKIDNFLVAFLVVLLLSIFLHFYNLNQQITWVDEPIYIVGGTKLLLQKTGDPLQWNFEHPPTAKYIIGSTAALSRSDKTPILDLSPNNYLGLGYPAVAKSIDDSLFFARMSSAIFGILLSLIIFLFAKDLYGKKAALLAFLISAVSIDMLTWSRLAYLDIFLVFFFTSSVYMFYKIANLAETRENKAEIKNQKIIYCILLGIFAGLAFTTKSTQPLPLLASLFVLSLFYRKKIYNKQVLPLILIPLLFTMLVTIGSLELFSKATFEYFGAANRQFSPNLIDNTLRILERIQSPLLLLFAASLFYLHKKKELLKNKIILVPLVFAFLSFVFSVNTSHRYFLPLIPFFILSISSINLENKTLKLLTIIMLGLTFYSVVQFFPEYTLHTNIIDRSLGNNYFWEEAGFAGLDEAAKYVSSNTNPEDIIFITQDAVRYRLFDRNILAYEAGQGLLYLTDGRVGQTDNIFCEGLGKFKENNITTLIIQNPKMLDKSYCNEIRELYNTEVPAQVITKNGIDVIKIFRV